MEVQWTKVNNYKFNHKRIATHKGNVGIVAGYNGLIILDIDNPKFQKEFDEKTNTFTVETGSGGRHYYFICGERFARNYYVLGENAGELRVANSQVVIPDSTHPNGTKYKVLKDVEIQSITKQEIQELLGALLKKDTAVVDISRSGDEWKEVCSMIESGYNFEDCDKEMKLLDFKKWIECGEKYRVRTYCNALNQVRGVR